MNLHEAIEELKKQAGRWDRTEDFHDPPVHDALVPVTSKTLHAISVLLNDPVIYNFLKERMK